MESIHVLVTGAPGLLREIVTQAVTSQPDMRILEASMDASASSSPSPEIGGPDVVVIILHNASDKSIDPLVARAFPTRAVVAIDTRGASVWSYDYPLRRSSNLAGELTPSTVVGAIRMAADRMGVTETSASPG